MPGVMLNKQQKGTLKIDKWITKHEETQMQLKKILFKIKAVAI
jgi:hypothetical protein